MGFLNSLFGGLGSLFGMGGGAAGGAGAAGGGGLGSSLMSLFQNPMVQGAGMLGLGQGLGGKVQSPNFNTPQMQAYQNFSQNPPALPQNMQDEINRSLDINDEQQNRNLRDVYKNLRPGTDYTTDSAYQRDNANLQRNLSSNRANSMMGPTLSYLQPMQQSMADNAQMSLYEPMLKAGMQSQQAQGTKDMFGNLGSMFFTKGLFPDLFKGFGTK